jgi:hypothetical protein
LSCHEKQESKDHDDRRGPATRGSQEVMQQVQVLLLLRIVKTDSR